MTLKQYLVFISTGIILLNFSELQAADVWNNKVKLEKNINLSESKRTIEVTVSNEEEYDFKLDKWSAYKYGLELGTDLTEHFGVSAEYKYIDKKKDEDEEEIEGNLSFEYKLPLNIEVKDENKLVTNIRKGNQVYENEFEACREIARFSGDRKISLLLGDVIVYDFQVDKWTENQVKVGLKIVFSKSWKLELKYCYIDVLDNPKNSNKIETELTFGF